MCFAIRTCNRCQEFVLNTKKILSVFSVCVLSVALFGTVFVGEAFASKASKMAQAQAIKKQIDALDNKVEIAAERYNDASVKYNAAIAKRQKAETKLAATRKRLGVVQDHLNDRANSMYRQGAAGFLEVLFGAENFDEFASTWDVLQELNDQDASSAAELKKIKAEMVSLTKTLRTQEAIAKSAQASMKAEKDQIEGQLAERQSKLKGVEAEIKEIQRREDAAAAAAARNSSNASGLGGSTSSGSQSFPAPTRAPRSEVVNIAKRYLGAPYQWAAAGPNRFDCSGFTMFVYRQVGVSLPHSSRSQIYSGQRVSRGDLQPGDLVFFGSPIHHVGIYVGGGMYIHAPQTGDVVKISSLGGRGDFAGACRP